MCVYIYMCVCACVCVCIIHRQDFVILPPTPSCKALINTNLLTKLYF